MSTEPATDRSNLLDLQRGNEAALDRVIDRWQRPLLSFAYRYLQNSEDAADLVAETFVRLYQRSAQLRPETNLSAWLFTTLTNLCHNQHRWRRRHPTVALGAAPERGPANDPGTQPGAEWLSGEPSPGENLMHDEALAALRQAIESIPHDLKVTILFHHYEHLSYREIAAILGCSERGVETRLYRARQHLRRELAGFLREASTC